MAIIYRCENEGCRREVDLSDKSQDLYGHCEGVSPVPFMPAGIHVYEQVRIEAAPDYVPSAWTGEPR